VFGPAFEAPRTDGDPNGLRRNLLKARALLEARPAGSSTPPACCATRRARPSSSSTWPPATAPTTTGAQPEAKLGITLKDRSVDFALYRGGWRVRLRHGGPSSKRHLHAARAGHAGAPATAASRPTRGQQQLPRREEPRRRRADRGHRPAETLPDLRDAARALDRVVMWSFWQSRPVLGPARTSRTGTASACPRHRRTTSPPTPSSPASSSTAPGRCGPGGTSRWAVARRLARCQAKGLKAHHAALHPQAHAADGAHAAGRADHHLRRDAVRARRAGRADHGRGARRAGRRHRRLQGRPRPRQEAARGAEEALRLRQAGARALLRDAGQLRCASTWAAASCRTRACGS
jgi:hypothetical protein